MSIFKKILHVLFIIGFVIFLLISFFLGIMFLLYGGEDSACLDSSRIWDYDEKRCRDDCLAWVDGKGCISLDVLAQIEKEVCGDSKCTSEQNLEVAKKECIIYGGAINLDRHSCDLWFKNENCGKLKGNWLYPKECNLSSEMTF